MVRRVGHFDVLFIERYQYGERFFHRKVKIFNHSRIPQTAYKHLSSKSSSTVRNHRAGPTTFVYTRVANLGDFSPNKANLGDSFEKCSGHF
jgi:hypothetical protein